MHGMTNLKYRESHKTNNKKNTKIHRATQQLGRMRKNNLQTEVVQNLSLSRSDGK
jgi:hypothetical protein